ncbi:MAG TPA: peptidoglycan DD-metalloendopeptidase family protein [Flavisolibacter sp.]|nr:peptidoglycan DD-metalloendopeptidase family protein [Flavisolibacter sp.]
MQTAKPSLEESLKQASNSFHPVVPFNSQMKLLRMDFTAANTALSDAMLQDTEKFTAYIDSQLQMTGAAYGIGGYNEHRTIYSRSRVFDEAGDEGPRRLHLGIDIWGKPHTPVMAPMDGVVHSFAFNDAFGDYGATIILSHVIGGIYFHTLYGHLGLDSIRSLREGQVIRMGEAFAAFGIPAENGHWPPHLHFQLVKDMQGKKGDYPGVCRYSVREAYLQNCPDPDLMLDMMKYAG